MNKITELSRETFIEDENGTFRQSYSEHPKRHVSFHVLCQRHWGVWVTIYISTKSLNRRNPEQFQLRYDWTSWTVGKEIEQERAAKPNSQNPVYCQSIVKEEPLWLTMTRPVILKSEFLQMWRQDNTNRIRRQRVRQGRRKTKGTDTIELKHSCIATAMFCWISTK